MALTMTSTISIAGEACRDLGGRRAERQVAGDGRRGRYGSPQQRGSLRQGVNR